jgi:Domain of Kin17 curved DNA-binding protein
VGEKLGFQVASNFNLQQLLTLSSSLFASLAAACSSWGRKQRLVLPNTLRIRCAKRAYNDFVCFPSVYIANRLGWYCQACERQMRDENGFKQHTMSEGHIRNMQLVGEDPRKFIRQYSGDFKRDFVTLLRTAHGEKPVHINK